jgi:hypothetical protein
MVSALTAALGDLPSVTSRQARDLSANVAIQPLMLPRFHGQNRATQDLNAKVSASLTQDRNSRLHESKCGPKMVFL